jgi:hypothetical protein
MNYWNEPYPSSMEELVSKCNIAIDLLLNKLQNSDCKTLSELYKTMPNGAICRQKKLFDELGYFPNRKMSSKFKKYNEIKGLYVFGEKVDEIVIPRYVGISGSIFRRLKQHGWGKLHNEATLAYLKAASKNKFLGKRIELSYVELSKQQELIRQYKVAIISEPLDFDLYFMEVYIAGKLKTHWNTFKTH